MSSQGNKFSTYASWAIIKNFARKHPCRASVIGTVFAPASWICSSTVEDALANQYEQESRNCGENQRYSGSSSDLITRERQIIGGSFWPRSRPGTTDLEADRGRNGDNQRAGPTDPDSDHGQIEKGRRGGAHRLDLAIAQSLRVIRQANTILTDGELPQGGDL